MVAQTRTPRSTWIEAGLAALASGGPDAVRVDLLAKALGVTRGGFYWHFASRQFANNLFPNIRVSANVCLQKFIEC